MGTPGGQAARLSSEQRASIMELGVRGAGGEFDTHIMSELMTMGFVEVESTSRSLVLTQAGRQIYAELLAKHAG